MRFGEPDWTEPTVVRKNNFLYNMGPQKVGKTEKMCSIQPYKKLPKRHERHYNVNAMDRLLNKENNNLKDDYL